MSVFLWRALGSIQETMGCLFSKKDKADAYLCTDGADDEHAAEKAGTSGRSSEPPSNGNGAFGSAGPAAASSQTKVRFIVIFCPPCNLFHRE